ncbi:hypothetical protein FRC18_007581 [Serendipita sp. 400]|nr:hypothetical protein FRC18_007581 [Serendipita sp. 400]
MDPAMAQPNKTLARPPKKDSLTATALDPQTMTSMPPHNTFMPEYAVPAITQYQQPNYSPQYAAPAYPSATPQQWQYSYEQYNNTTQNVHYRQIVPAVPPVQQAAQGTPSWPVQLRIDTQVQPQSASMHTLHRHSESPTSLFSRPSEVGPSRTVRTGRTARRRSIQEASPAMSPLDADGGDVLESASSKRSKGGTPSSSSSSDPKGFSCDFCLATFTRKGDCLRHRRSVHTRETPYDCQGCGEQFSRSDVRGKHWKSDPACENAHWKEVCRAMGRSGLIDG